MNKLYLLAYYLTSIFNTVERAKQINLRRREVSNIFYCAFILYFLVYIRPFYIVPDKMNDNCCNAYS